MGQVLHGCATTTEAICRAMQNGQESLRTLAKRYEINLKTIAKWKKRASVGDLPTTIPHLTRSSLHRCLQRQGISRLPEVEGDRPNQRKLKSYPIGYFHIDIAEVRTAEGKLYLLVAIGPRSLPSPSCTPRRPRVSRPTSCAPWSRRRL
jgi:hypothetical protein